MSKRLCTCHVAHPSGELALQAGQGAAMWHVIHGDLCLGQRVQRLGPIAQVLSRAITVTVLARV